MKKWGGSQDYELTSAQDLSHLEKNCSSFNQAKYLLIISHKSSKFCQFFHIIRWKLPAECHLSLVDKYLERILEKVHNKLLKLRIKCKLCLPETISEFFSQIYFHVLLKVSFKELY